MSSKELAPPVFMRHMQHSKEPLPAIGGHAPPKNPMTHSDVDSPNKNLDESETAVVGSLAMARRRARREHQHDADSPQQKQGTSQQHSPQRSPSPPEAPQAPPHHQQPEGVHDGDEAELVAGRPKPSHKTCGALLDVLDPDTDGSTIVDCFPGNANPFAPQQQRPPAAQQEAHNPFHRGFS